MKKTSKKRSASKGTLISNYEFIMKGANMNTLGKVNVGDSFEKFSLYKEYPTTATPSTSLG